MLMSVREYSLDFERSDDDDGDWYHRGHHAFLLLKLRPMGIDVRGNTTKLVRPAGYGNSTSCGASELRAVLLVLW